MICDTLQHLTRYKGLCKNLDTAIDYLLTHDPASLPLGRTEVDGEEVFINTMDATLHSDHGYHPEYHKKYADLQLDITGSESWNLVSNSVILWSSASSSVKPFSSRRIKVCAMALRLCFFAQRS